MTTTTLPYTVLGCTVEQRTPDPLDVPDHLVCVGWHPSGEMLLVHLHAPYILRSPQGKVYHLLRDLDRPARLYAITPCRANTHINYRANTDIQGHHFFTDQDGRLRPWR